MSLTSAELSREERLKKRRRLISWCLLLTLVLCWPTLLNGGALIFFDSASYFESGRKIAKFLHHVLFSSDAANADTIRETKESVDNDGVKRIRSLVYSLILYVSSISPLSFWGAVLLQSFLCVITITKFLRNYRTNQMYFGALLTVATVSSLPWYASFAMPDVYAGLIIVIALIMVRDAEQIDLTKGLALGLVATIAAAVHYGHPPLSLGLGISVLVVLIWQRRLHWPVAILAVAPAAIAMLINLVASAIVFEKPSVAPKRLPILLARSIEDGPARWHLEEHCELYRYAICGHFETIPQKASEVLFGKNGLVRHATEAEMEHIRAEESLILRRAFREYPWAQIRDTLGNIGLQFIKFGTKDFRWGFGRTIGGSHLTDSDQPKNVTILKLMARLHLVVLLAACAAIVTFAFRDGLKVGPHERSMLGIALLGLLLNAAIFGGLSAPADRYQGRVIWILPAIALLFWSVRRESRA